MTEHFSSPEVQRHAARLGMWLFLGSELLLFCGLFTLYAVHRGVDPHSFHEGFKHAKVWIGSTNTFILLTSSFVAASAVEVQRRAHPIAAAALAIVTALGGVAFLILKGVEYDMHVHEGMLPGHSMFWTLYWVMTGIHAIHVTVGCGLLVFFASVMIVRKRSGGEALVNTTLYWHTVDIIWIFLWPMFYLGQRQ